MNRAIFVDRDGVLNALVFYPDTGEYESPRGPADFRLKSDALPALNDLQAQGWLLILISNQPSYAKGKTALASLHAVHAELEKALAGAGVVLQRAYYCFHHPNGIVPEYTGPCNCRKPQPGSLLAARREFDLDLSTCWMVGDQDADIQCGQNAGCRTAQIDYPPSAPRRGHAAPDVRCQDLADFVRILAEVENARSSDERNEH